jgi:hypothetical protein
MEGRISDRIRRVLAGTISRRRALKVFSGSLGGSAMVAAGFKPAAAEVTLPQYSTPFSEDLGTEDNERLIRAPQARLGSPLSAGIYTIRQKSSGRFVDAYESDSEDYQLVTRLPQGNFTQLWVLTEEERVLITSEDLGTSVSAFRMRQLSTRRYVDAWEEAGEDYRLVTRTHQDNRTQIWMMSPVGDGSYTIWQLNTRRYVDAHEYAGEDYRLVTRLPQDNDTQRWLFDRVFDF